jgi:hypothetical protein
MERHYIDALLSEDRSEALSLGAFPRAVDPL